MSLPWIEMGIAGSVLGLGLVELYNLRRIRLQREAQELADSKKKPPSKSEPSKSEDSQTNGAS